LAAVEATDCGMEGTVNCDSRDTRPPRAGAGAAVVAGVAGADVEEAAAVFFMGLDGAGGTAWAPAGLDEGAPAAAAGALLLAAGLGGAAADLAETFFAAGTACLATTVFLTAGFDAGLADAAGFFTVTGSFDGLGRAFRSWGLADGEPRGYTPESSPETRPTLCRKSHFAQKDVSGSRNRRAIV